MRRDLIRPARRTKIRDERAELGQEKFSERRLTEIEFDSFHTLDAFKDKTDSSEKFVRRVRHGIERPALQSSD
jgi:hypothetical protein